MCLTIRKSCCCIAWDVEYYITSIYRKRWIIVDDLWYDGYMKWWLDPSQQQSIRQQIVIFRHLFICDVVVVVDQDAYCCIYTYRRLPIYLKGHLLGDADILLLLLKFNLFISVLLLLLLLRKILFHHPSPSGCYVNCSSLFRG